MHLKLRILPVLVTRAIVGLARRCLLCARLRV
jgi:hypothetical protein